MREIGVSILLVWEIEMVFPCIGSVETLFSNYIYIYIYIYIKENARTTTFTATCSYQVMSYGVKMVDPQALSLPGLVHVDIRSSWHRLSPTKSPPLPYYFFSIVSYFYLYFFFQRL